MAAPRGQRLVAAAVLAVAGYCDSLAFLSFRERFVSFASGSTAELLVRRTRGEGGQAVLVALVGAFAGGVLLGALAGRRAGRARRRTVLGLAALAIAAAALRGRPDLLTLGGVAVAMGLLNTVDREPRAGRTAITYVTGTLVRFADALAEGGRAAEWLVPAAMIGSFALGVVAGTRAALAWGLWSLWPVAAVLAGLSAATALADRRR